MFLDKDTKGIGARQRAEKSFGVHVFPGRTSGNPVRANTPLCSGKSVEADGRFHGELRCSLLEVSSGPPRESLSTASVLTLVWFGACSPGGKIALLRIGTTTKLPTLYPCHAQDVPKSAQDAPKTCPRRAHAVTTV